MKFIFLSAIVLMLFNTFMYSQNPYKQANTVGSEICIDAPYHMQKYDEFGNLNSVPIHVFIHGSNSLGCNNELMNVRINIKNASDSEFLNVITFDDYSEEDFLDLFVNKSYFDGDFDIQTFDQSQPVRNGSKTIDFVSDSHVFPATTYTDIIQDFWWFTILIPADKLEGYENIIDFKIDCELDWDPDYNAYLRVFRQEDDFPTMDNWLRGDVHYHGIYTQNDAEVGLPLDATKLMAQYCGLDWITLTDHSCDYDNTGINENSNWSDLGDIVEDLNSIDDSFIFIRAIEMTIKNSSNDHVHALTYPSHSDPFSMPYFGDGDGDLIATNVTIDNLVSDLVIYDAFVYAAHPFAEGDELSFAVDGSVWNISDSDFAENGQAHEYMGSVICNNIGESSDIFSSDENKLFKDGIVGGEIWNMANYLDTDEADNPWDVEYEGGDSFELFSIYDVEHTTSRFMQNFEVVKFLWNKGLEEKNYSNDISNWKFFMSAGSDAHGSFNYSNTDLFMSVSGLVTDNAIGKLSSLAYCPIGTGSNGQNILHAMRNGNLILSSGPIVSIEIDTDGNSSTPEIIIGNDAEMNYNTAENAVLNLFSTTSDEYGNVVRKQLVIQTVSETVVIDLSNDVVDWQQNLLQILEDNFVSSADYLDQWILIRAELETIKASLNLSIYKRTNAEYYSYTNPIWLKIDSPASSTSSNYSKFSVYPNPAEDYFVIDLVESSKNAILEICNLEGKVVFCETVKDQQSINTSTLTPGVYFMYLQDVSDCQKTKLVIF